MQQLVRKSLTETTPLAPENDHIPANNVRDGSQAPRRGIPIPKDTTPPTPLVFSNSMQIRFFHQCRERRLNNLVRHGVLTYLFLYPLPLEHRNIHFYNHPLCCLWADIWGTKNKRDAQCKLWQFGRPRTYPSSPPSSSRPLPIAV